MIVNRDRLIQLLSHQDARVRDASVHALERFFSGSPGIIEYILQSIKVFRDDCLSLVAGIKHFTPSINDVQEIVSIINETDKHRDENSLNIYFHLTQSFLSFPFEILTKNRNIFSFNKELTKLYEILQNRDGFKKQDPKHLWNELTGFCSQHHDKPVEGENVQYAQLLLEALSQYGDQIKGKIVVLLSQEKPDNYLLNEYMVDLAGRLKLEKTVPYLFRILQESDFMHTVHSLCIRTLGNIGTKEVAKDIEDLYYSNQSLKTAFADILKYIPYDYAEDLAIQLIKEEKDVSAKTFLACALCDMFSLKGIATIKDMIKVRSYDSGITTLADDLIPVDVYHNESLDELLVLEATSKKHEREQLQHDSLYQMGQELQKHLDFPKTVQGKTQKKELPNNKRAENVVSLKKERNKRKRKHKKKGKK